MHSATQYILAIVYMVPLIQGHGLRCIYRGTPPHHRQAITVESPIMDSPRYGLPPYNGQLTCPPINLAIKIIHFEPLRYGQPLISRQQIENVPPRGN